MPENKTEGEQSSRTTGKKNNRRTMDSSSSRHNGHVHQMAGNNSSKKKSINNDRKGIPQKNHIEMGNIKNIVYRQRQRIRKQNHGEFNAKLRNTTFENTTIPPTIKPNRKMLNSR